MNHETNRGKTDQKEDRWEGAAPRTRFLPSLSVSVTMGLAAGRYLCWCEYL